MLYSDAMRATSTTGGTGTLTLAALDSYPLPGDVIGSVARYIPYQIQQFSSSTLTQEESGIGSIASGVLTRSKIQKTWTGGVANVVNPTALNFATSGIVITFGGGSITQKTGLSSPFTLTGSDQWIPFDTRVTYDSNLGTFTMTNGNRLYMPIEFIHAGVITSVALDVSTGVASSTARMGVYDTDPSSGMPINLITEFTSSTQIDTSGSAGFKSITPGSPVWMPPGFYWLCIQGNSSTVVIRRYSHMCNGLISSSSGSRDILMWDKSSTYGALPATADTTSSNIYSRSGGGKCMGLFK